MSNPLSSKSISAITSDDDQVLNDIELLLADEYEDDFSEKSIDILEDDAPESIDAKMDIADADFEEIIEEPKKAVSKAKKEAKPKKAASKPKKEASEESEKTPRISTAGLKPDEALRKRYGQMVYQIVVLEDKDAELSEKALNSLVDEHLETFDTSAKKVGEKIINFFQAVNGEAKLSVYTDIAIKLLAEKKKVTIAEIKQAYLDYPYKVGTASAQSSQMSQLLPMLKLAKKEGTTLVANENSLLLRLLTSSK